MTAYAGFRFAWPGAPVAALPYVVEGGRVVAVDLAPGGTPVAAVRALVYDPNARGAGLAGWRLAAAGEVGAGDGEGGGSPAELPAALVALLATIAGAPDGALLVADAGALVVLPVPADADAVDYALGIVAGRPAWRIGAPGSFVPETVWTLDFSEDFGA